ncbi:hypothetical protein Gogos_012716 [Gossypium gossypioides]|uniref:Terpene synthase metal-binding domain-containing protein n=1 Tax=Gossypium gossypioides TaxID=34282 RepID=A0A7J9BTD8_GOSGO|nr:hypothetical protein [Gossypium gossypioides]
MELISTARDRLMENFLWIVGLAFDPHFGNLRRTLTKVNALITSIDDVCDVYGTLDELELFTQAVERIYEDMFLALYNSINEIAFDNLKEHGFHTISFLKKAGELKRGDASKSIQCYMHETSCSEEESREQVKTLIDATWKRMNEEYLMSQSSLSLPFKHIALNLARMAQCMYQYGDGHGVEDQETKDRVLLLLVSSIPYL